MIELIILLVVIGAALYLLGLAPLDPTVKTVIKVVVVVAVIVYVLRHLSVLGL